MSKLFQVVVNVQLDGMEPESPEPTQDDAGQAVQAAMQLLMASGYESPDVYLESYDIAAVTEKP